MLDFTYLLRETYMKNLIHFSNNNPNHWENYAGSGLHWSFYDLSLILRWQHSGEYKSITLLRLKPAKA